MRIQDIGKLSTRAFQTNPGRTWLTILGMGVGIGAVVSMVGLGFGLQKILLEQIVLGDTLLSLNVSNQPPIVLTDDTVANLKAIPNVKDVAPLASLSALLTYQGLTGNTLLEGASSAYLRYAGIQAVAGNIWKDNDPAAASEVLISTAMLNLFDVTDPKDVLGKTMTFKAFVPKGIGTTDTEEVDLGKTYTIIGVVKDDSQIYAMATLTEFNSHFTVPSYDKAEVRVTDTGHLPDVQTAVVTAGFHVTALSKTVDQANKIFIGVQVVLGVFGSVALLVSAIGMFNTMTVTLLERTKEIGIMRTLGATSTDINILFTVEAIVVGTLGGVSGIVMGLFVGFSMNGLLAFAASRFGGKALSLFYFPFWFIAAIFVFSAIVGYLTGVFPARKAAAMNPLDAIRFG